MTEIASPPRRLSKVEGAATRNDCVKRKLLTGSVLALLLALALLSVVTSSRPANAAGPLTTPQTSRRIFPRYTFDVNLDYDAHRLQVVEQVEFTNTHGVPLPEIVFNVPAAHGVGVFYLQDLNVNHAPAPFDLDGTVLTVTLPSALLPDETVTMTIGFVLYVERLGAQVESFAAANLCYTDDVLTAGYWHPLLAPYQVGRGWLTVPWHSVGDPFVSESADYAATITATEGADIVAGGDVTRQGQIWHVELPRARSLALIASPRYDLTEVSVGGVTYSLYTFRKHTQLAPVTLQTMMRAAWLYGTLYGPYPYASLRMAEVNGPWSLEFSGLVTLGEEEFASYNGTQRNRLVRITAHEVSHQWWYGVVGNDQAREPWLDESLARYNEVRYLEFYSPNDVNWWWNQVIYRSEAYGDVAAAAYDFRAHTAYIAAVYNRGAQMLDALRTRVGSAAFNTALRDLYRQGSFDLITADRFWAALSAHTDADWRYTARWFMPDLPIQTHSPSSGNLMPAQSNFPHPQGTPQKRIKECALP